MKKKHKKKLIKLLTTLILMLIVTIGGYFRSEFIDENEQILAKPVRKNTNII